MTIPATESNSRLKSVMRMVRDGESLQEWTGLEGPPKGRQQDS